jgi:ParB family chromosome partitioning protein
MRQLLNTSVDSIEVGPRLRPLNKAKVALIRDSYERTGQITPIELSPRGANKWRLVVGLHRLEAVKAAGGKTIDFFRFEGDADAQELREIEENLARADLTALDRAFAVSRWVHHLGIQHRANATDKSIANQSFATMSKRLSAKVAEKVGLDERSIYRDLKLAKLLADDHQKLAGLPIANAHNELQRLARLEPSKRKPIIAAMAAGKTFQEATAKNSKAQPKDQALSALIALWRKTPVAAKRAFVKANNAEIAQLLEGRGK